MSVHVAISVSWEQERQLLMSACSILWLGRVHVNVKIFKMFVGHAPDYIASLLTPASDIPSRSSLRSSSNCDLVVPRTSRKTGDRAFSVAALRAWSRLPTDLKILRSTASFKTKLKSFLFHAAYTGNTVWTLECAIGLIVGGALQVTVVTATLTVTVTVFSQAKFGDMSLLQ